MIFQRECPICYGCGVLHSPGCNGDPDDSGVICERCEGLGCIDVEVDEDGDEI